MESEWQKSTLKRYRVEEMSTLEMKDSNGRSLRVCAEVQMLPGGTRWVALFVPYWVVNHSDLHVLVRSSPRYNLEASFGGHIVAGQNEAITVMRRLRMRKKLHERYSRDKGITGGQAAPGGLLDLLDESSLRYVFCHSMSFPMTIVL